MPSFLVLAKPSGPICNLACEYCFYLEKKNLYKDAKSWILSKEVLDAFVREYIRSQNTPTVTFAWQGGEPTLCGIEYFEKIIELQNKYAGGRKIENALQTNGTLLDDNWGEFLAEHRFLVGVSIDGPQEYHDAYRRDKQGNPTFKKALRGLRILKKHGVDFNTLCVVNRRNSYAPREVYRFLKELGSRFMQFIPLVEYECQVTERSVEPLQYGLFLSEIFDEWVRRDVGRWYVQTFDIAMEAWMGYPPGLCVFGKTCGGGLVLEHNGDVYSCDHFVAPEHRLGNIRYQPLDAMAHSDKQFRFGQDKADTLPRYCKECGALFACNGACPKDRFLNAPSGEPGLNYLCEGYRHFFGHIGPAMEFMAGELRAGRPPANVMKWARAGCATSA